MKIRQAFKIAIILIDSELSSTQRLKIPLNPQGKSIPPRMVIKTNNPRNIKMKLTFELVRLVCKFLN